MNWIFIIILVLTFVFLYYKHAHGLGWGFEGFYNEQQENQLAEYFDRATFLKLEINS